MGLKLSFCAKKKKKKRYHIKDIYLIYLTQFKFNSNLPILKLIHQSQSYGEIIIAFVFVCTHS